MAYAVGIVLALLTCAVARVVGFDRDRAFYPTILVIIASYYVLFAVMGGSTKAIVVEPIIMTLFVAIAVVGFKFNLWLVVVGLAAHGVFDFVHDRLVTNPGVPAWWPAFCLAYDVVVAALLAWMVLRRNSAVVRPHAVSGGNSSLTPSNADSTLLRFLSPPGRESP